MYDNRYMTLKLIKKYLKISDLFLAIWLITGFLLFLEHNRFLSYTDGTSLSFLQPFPLCVIYFVILIIDLPLYLFFEYKREAFEIKKSIILFFGYLLLSNLITVLLTPNNMSFSILDTTGYYFNVDILLNFQIKCLFLFNYFFLTVTVFIFVFIFKKRVSSIKVISFIIHLVYLFVFVAFAYSLFSDNYILYFQKILFESHTSINLKEYAPVSFMGNQNMYGMVIEMCLFGSLISYQINKKKYNIVVSALCYIDLLITLCKVGILLSTIVLFLYLIILIVQSIYQKKKRLTIVLVSILFSIVIVVTALIIWALINYKNGYHNVLNIETTLTGRLYIWDTSIQIITNTSLVRGAGFGVYDMVILNAVGHYGYHGSTTHNFILSIIGKGGIIYLAMYLSLLIYSFIKLTKLYKTSKDLFIILFVTLIMFIAHSLFEDNYWIVIVFVIISIIITELNNKKCVE